MHSTTTTDVLPQHQRHLRDVFGSPICDGSCVPVPDREIVYVRLEFGTRRGPDSAYWDGWSSATRTREAHPLSGKVMTGNLVRIIGSAA